jgi:ABC-2 type transport system permease protein
MFVAFCFVCFAFLGLGLIIAMISDNVPAVQALGQAIFLPLIIIGGVGVHYAALPHWAQHVANFLPGKYAVDALQACQNGDGLRPARLNLLALTVIGLAAIMAGSKMFRWDIAQKISRPAQAWVALAVVAWIMVGCGTEYPNWKHFLDPKPRPATVVVPAQTPQTLPSVVATTMPTTVAAAPKEPWELVTKAQIDGVDYDNLPSDLGNTTPFAPDLNSLDDDGKKRMESFNDALGDWPPGQVSDVPQRIRNLLSICAIADVAEDQHEGQIPFVIFDYLRGNIQKDKLINALTWIILNEKEGTVLTNLKEYKNFGIDADIGEDDVRSRSTIYAKKMLFRLLGKMPPDNNK